MLLTILAKLRPKGLNRDLVQSPLAKLNRMAHRLAGAKPVITVERHPCPIASLTLTQYPKLARRMKTRT